MFVKTNAIVINRIKHTDSRLIANILTPQYGKIAILVHNKRSKRSKGNGIFFQPLNILHTEINIRENKNIQNLKEVEFDEQFDTLNTDFHKQSIAIFLAEILNKTIRESEPSPELFNFTRQNILLFDNIKENSNNFHLFFLAHLMKYLGFAPGNEISEKNKFLDADTGLFVGEDKLNSSCFTNRESKIINYFINMSADNISDKKISRIDRSSGLETILEYYSFHIPNFKNLKSYDVLKSIYE